MADAAEWRARFARLVDGTEGALLQQMAVTLAWYGQYYQPRRLHEPDARAAFEAQLVDSGARLTLTLEDPPPPHAADRPGHSASRRDGAAGREGSHGRARGEVEGVGMPSMPRGTARRVALERMLQSQPRYALLGRAPVRPATIKPEATSRSNPSQAKPQSQDQATIPRPSH
eukprot:3748112-Prymnesium_polylepis.1